jgi:hypothetical protein
MPEGHATDNVRSFESLQVNYLTIPVYIMACIILLVATSVSDRMKKRAAVAIFPPMVVIVGYAIAIGTSNGGAGYFAMFLCSGGKCGRIPNWKQKLTSS